MAVSLLGIVKLRRWTFLQTSENRGGAVMPWSKALLFMISYEQIRRVQEKEDIFENSELTCFCKILGSGNFLQVRPTRDVNHYTNSYVKVVPAGKN
jgi:hypothetical protein